MLRCISYHKEKVIEEALQKKFMIDLEYEPVYHANGFTYPNLQIITMDEPNHVYPASWGLIPSWGQHDVEAFRKKSNTLNARSETVFMKNSFKDSAREQRCLIIADGFFEPHHVSDISIAHYCYIPSLEFDDGRDIFLFAGLYTELDDHAYSCTILTTEANEFFAEVHNKRKSMPLVLDEFFLDEWLMDDLGETELNELMAVGFTTKKFEAHPVTRDLYKRGMNTNTPEILNKVTTGTLFD